MIVREPEGSSSDELSAMQFSYQRATNVGNSLFPKRPVMRQWLLDDPKAIATDELTYMHFSSQHATVVNNSFLTKRLVMRQRFLLKKAVFEVTKVIVLGGSS